MNTAKNASKGQGTQGKQGIKKGDKKPSNKILKLFLAASIVCIAVLSIFIGYEQLHKPLIVKVNDSKVYYEDMMYYIYSSEAQLSYFNQMYQGQMGADTNYMDMDAGDGKTIRDMAKQEALDTAIKYEVLYSEAIKAGKKLTKEQKAETKTQVTEIMKQLLGDQKEKTGFTEEYLTEQLNKMAVANGYAKGVIDGFNIDDEAIKVGVNYEEFKQYDIQMYGVQTAAVNAEGTAVALPDKEKKEAYDKLVALYEKAKTADDFTTLTDTQDQENPIKFKETKFISSDENVFSETIKEQLMKMENGEMTDIVETKDGYFLIKMVNNNSSERYDSEVKKAIATKENEAFDEEYNKILKTYNVKINNKEWDRITFGNITI